MTICRAGTPAPSPCEAPTLHGQALLLRAGPPGQPQHRLRITGGEP